MPSPMHCSGFPKFIVYVKYNQPGMFCQRAGPGCRRLLFNARFSARGSMSAMGRVALDPSAAQPPKPWALRPCRANFGHGRFFPVQGDGQGPGQPYGCPAATGRKRKVL